MPTAVPSARPSLLEQVRAGGAVPRHVAVIMDGNGRWAAQRGRSRAAGHRAGMVAAKRVIDAAVQAGVPALSLYALSQENWQRPIPEVSALLAGFELHLRNGLQGRLVRDGVALGVLGDLDRLPPRQRSAIEEAVRRTAGGTRLRCTLALSYGSRAEIAATARRLAERVEQGALRAGDIDERCFAASLPTADLPDPDLLIRTSGERRLSNFLLWQLAYAELHFTPVLWPDFTAAHLYAAIRDYQGRERRYGRVGEAVLPPAAEDEDEGAGDA